MTVLERQVTTTEFERFLQQMENDDRIFELIDGEVVEKPTMEEHGIIMVYGWFGWSFLINAM